MNAEGWVRITVNIHHALLDEMDQDEREQIVAEAAVDGFRIWQTKTEREERISLYRCPGCGWIAADSGEDIPVCEDRACPCLRMDRVEVVPLSRALVAEQRMKELEEALREISCPDPRPTSNEMREIALRALTKSEELHD